MMDFDKIELMQLNEIMALLNAIMLNAENKKDTRKVDLMRSLLAGFKTLIPYDEEIND